MSFPSSLERASPSPEVPVLPNMEQHRGWTSLGMGCRITTIRIPSNRDSRAEPDVADGKLTSPRLSRMLSADFLHILHVCTMSGTGD